MLPVPDGPSDPRTWMQEVFAQRFSCKYYLPDRPLDPRDLEAIIEVGRLSPSSMGLEPWHFVSLRDPELVAQIAAESWGGKNKIGVAPELLAILVRTPAQLDPRGAYVTHIIEDVQRLPEALRPVKIEKMARFQSDDLAADTPEMIFEWAVRQAYIPLANMLTAAAILGIDATPIEGFDQARVHEILVERGVYDPAELKIATLLTFGYSARDPRPKTRRPLSEVYSVF